MSDSFGIGFVSAGFITRESHVPSVGYLPDVHVAGIQNRTQATAADLADTCRTEGWGDPSVYGADAVTDLVADPDVDGLWVTSPNFTRVDVVEAAVEAVEDGADLQGIALEKPVARNLSEATHIVDLIGDAGIPHAYLENWAHEPDIDKLRQLLWEQGREAGRPYIARSQAEHGGPHSGWFWDGRKQGGGALTDMLCHALAGNDFLLSDPAGEASLEPVSVSADTETVKWSQDEYADQLADDFGLDFQDSPVDDYARTTVRYEDDQGNTVISEARSTPDRCSRTMPPPASSSRTNSARARGGPRNRPPPAAGCPSPPPTWSKAGSSPRTATPSPRSATAKTDCWISRMACASSACVWPPTKLPRRGRTWTCGRPI